MFYKCYSSWRFPQNDSYQKFGFKRNQFFFVTWLDFFVSVGILYHLPFLVGGPQGQNSAHFFLMRWHFFLPQTPSKACKRFVTPNKQTIAFSTIFKSMNKTHHFSDIFKTYFTHKQITFHLNPFHPANVISALRKSGASLFLLKKWGASLFLQKKWSTSLFLQKKTLICFWKNNEAFHFFLKKSWDTSFFLKK